ncbi:hypothetical protein AMAG_11240 [Allomyces macrogynus ATCC 38327]|uniref:Uncharacterized protein n=1 Tax=Allomyces macrogynus (strain ATCC 38327) TaxID=578462 RepID=A0A0L0SVX4_ALLM3|nr:hypothetical protein AMAG_11240 [Allomyces macrogynus ATCC 38327]|eukprot:KNE66743.1 hypothetical protein AMAG_11240 [Allomyces macrogynus ATCC 38327]
MSTARRTSWPRAPRARISLRPPAGRPSASSTPTGSKGVLQDDTLPQYTHFRDPTELPRPVVGATPIPPSAIDRIVRAAREHQARVQECEQRALESLLDAQGHLAGEPVEERRANEKLQVSLRNQWQELRKLGRTDARRWSSRGSLRTRIS